MAFGWASHFCLYQNLFIFHIRFHFQRFIFLLSSTLLSSSSTRISLSSLLSFFFPSLSSSLSTSDSSHLQLLHIRPLWLLILPVALLSSSFLRICPPVSSLSSSETQPCYSSSLQLLHIHPLKLLIAWRSVVYVGLHISLGVRNIVQIWEDNYLWKKRNISIFCWVSIIW